VGTKGTSKMIYSIFVGSLIFIFLNSKPLVNTIFDLVMLYSYFRKSIFLNYPFFINHFYITCINLKRFPLLVNILNYTYIKTSHII